MNEYKISVISDEAAQLIGELGMARDIANALTLEVG